jgi:hypothetical protein
LNLIHYLGRCQSGITRNLPATDNIPNRCNPSLICVIMDFPVSGKSYIFFLTSKSTLDIIHN